MKVLYANPIDRFKSMKMFEEDGGGGAGGSTGDGGSEGNEKTFTQEQVNSMLAAEKRKYTSSAYKNLGFESEEQAKDFVKKYKEQEEANKTELEKEQQRAQQLQAEKNAEQQKAQNLEYKFEAMKEGCSADSAADVVVLAKAKMSDEKDFAAALKEVKEQYPAMFGQNGNAGTGTGGGGTHARKKMGSDDVSGIGKRLAEQRKKSNATKENNYFK